MNKPTAAIILAAGMGKRMKSELPKVLHKIDGKPLIRHLLETMRLIPLERTVVVIGHKGELVEQELKDFPVKFVWQKDQLGTGHAVMVAEAEFKDFDGTVLVAAGDVPFLSAETIQRLINFHRQHDCAATCLSVELKDPAKYGRIIRQPGTDILSDIIEYKDADEKTLLIKEINTGTFCFRARDLFPALYHLKDDNAQKELYLTDTIKILRQAGQECRILMISDPLEVAGINSAEELAALEAAVRQKKY